MPLLLDPGGRSAELRFAAPERSRVLFEATPADGARAVPKSRRTLDDVLSEAWEGLLAAAPVDCPVCAAELSSRWSAGAGVVGGPCRNCGSELG
jgi:hypothetical protein